MYIRLKTTAILVALCIHTMITFCVCTVLDVKISNRVNLNILLYLDYLIEHNINLK